jgi:hypothetical protein
MERASCRISIVRILKGKAQHTSWRWRAESQFGLIPPALYHDPHVLLSGMRIKENYTHIHWPTKCLDESQLLSEY